uniref:(northern house mosquito) hypothetical protein n=1 Tax=Culex pipiens TaxID=7175 RepID=A0A8D8JID6_CULPI
MLRTERRRIWTMLPKTQGRRSSRLRSPPGPRTARTPTCSLDGTAKQQPGAFEIVCLRASYRTHRPRKLKTMNLVALKRGKGGEKSGARHHRFIRIQRLL